MKQAPTARAGGRSEPFDPSAINLRAFGYYRRLARLERYVDSHPQEHLSLRRAADIAGLSRQYFSTYFHHRTGVRFRDWVAHLRVRQAKSLMRARNDSITDVGFSSGFRDLRTFERVFKKHTGMTPRAFKRTVRPS